MNLDSAIFNQFAPQLLLVSAWSLLWKGLAPWRAARANQRYWYIALLVLNTLGIAEIIYLTWFTKENRFWDKIAKKQSAKK